MKGMGGFPSKYTYDGVPARDGGLAREGPWNNTNLR